MSSLFRSPAATLALRSGVYALRSGEAPSLKYTLDEASAGLFSVAFSADTNLLSSGGSGAKVRVHALASGAPR